jgi:hypothetical protein
MKTKPTPERIARALTNARTALEREHAGQQPAELRAHYDDNDTAGTLEISHDDAYSACALAALKRRPRYLSMTVAGWAAPVEQNNDDDTPPSLHPKRQRVALCAVVEVGTGKLTSAMRMTTAARPLVSDDTESSGALADTLRELARRIAAQHDPK